MNHTDQRTTLAPIDTTCEAPDASWPRGNPVRAWLRGRIADLRERVRGREIQAAAALVAAVLLVIALPVLIRFGGAVISGVAGIDIGAAAVDVKNLPVVRLITEPVWHWIAVHTAGLPISPAGVAGTWFAFGVAMLIGASAGLQLDFVLWVLHGIATAAMAWFGADVTAHRPVVAGAVVLAWFAATSILTYVVTVLGTLTTHLLGHAQ